jgi:hypothetical protein
MHPPTVGAGRRVDTKLISFVTKVMPLAFVVMAVLTIVQFWLQHGPSGNDLNESFHRSGAFMHTHAWVVYGVGVAAWALVFLGYFYERLCTSNRRIVRRGLAMDILDRLSNRQALVEKLAAEPDTVFIDADKLSLALKSRVIGQDAVCDDMASQIRRRLALKQREKPVGVFMLAGPPGTGKTYLAKCVSQELNRKLLHLDAAQFEQQWCDSMWAHPRAMSVPIVTGSSPRVFATRPRPSCSWTSSKRRTQTCTRTS